jgi:hypothetical protein
MRNHLISLVATHLRDLRRLIPYGAKIDRFLLLIEHLVIAIGHKPQDTEAVVAQIIGALDFMQVFANF